MQKQGLINSLHPDAKKVELSGEMKQFKDYLPGEKDKQVAIDPTGFVKVQGKTFTEVVNELILTDKPIDQALADITKTYNDAFDQAVKDGKIKAEDYKK
ncbi:hypothetical protein D3C85_1570470 [compost metagenome]